MQILLIGDSTGTMLETLHVVGDTHDGHLNDVLLVERYMNDLLQYVSATMNNDRSGIAVSSCANYVDPEVQFQQIDTGGLWVKTGSEKNMLILVGLDSHYTYNITLSVSVELNQKKIFLQDRHKSVVFILHQEVQQHGRAFYVDCVGLSTLKDMFLYHLTAESMDMDTYVTMEFVPEVHTQLPKHTFMKKYLAVPSAFAGDNGILSLSVCIIKDDLGLHDRNAHKVLKVVLNEPYVLDCSICLEPFKSRAYSLSMHVNLIFDIWNCIARMPIQHAPHAAPSSRVSVYVAVTTITVVEVLRRSSNQSVKYHANMLNIVVKRQSLTMKRSSIK
ncbi:hypothetical protein Tco_0685140 [Tanacetum coccineum]